MTGSSLVSGISSDFNLVFKVPAVKSSKNLTRDSPVISPSNLNFLTSPSAGLTIKTVGKSESLIPTKSPNLFPIPSSIYDQERTIFPFN